MIASENCTAGIETTIEVRADRREIHHEFLPIDLTYEWADAAILEQYFCQF